MDATNGADPVIEARRLTKRYRRHPALTDVHLQVPAGRLVGLVGPNGAGKSTLLQLAAGLLRPSAGTISVLGHDPAGRTSQRARLGYVAQSTPVLTGLTVADHLGLGRRLNPAWDQGLAERRIARLGLDPHRRAGRLSGGQRAQLALTLAVAKGAELLIFDEPVAALDPLARRQFLQSLLDVVSGLDVTVVLSSHLISDLEQVCDHLIVLADSEVQVAGDVDHLLASHASVAGPRADLDHLPAGAEVIMAEHDIDQSRAVIRITEGPPPERAEPISLEDLALAHLARARAEEAAR